MSLSVNARMQVSRGPRTTPSTLSSSTVFPFMTSFASVPVRRPNTATVGPAVTTRVPAFSSTRTPFADAADAGFAAGTATFSWSCATTCPFGAQDASAFRRKETL